MTAQPTVGDVVALLLRVAVAWTALSVFLALLVGRALRALDRVPVVR